MKQWWMVLLLLLAACTEDANAPAELADAQPAAHPGKALMEGYCGTCHLAPQPTDLPTKTWHDHILVRMGAYMGIYYDNVQYHDEPPKEWIEPGEGGQAMLAAGVYPKSPTLSREEFEQIRDYILSHSPATTSGPPGLRQIQPELPGFTARPLQPDATLQPLVTAVSIAPGRIYAAYFQQSLLELNAGGKVLDRIEGIYGPVFLNPDEGQFSMANIGSMGGSDKPQGDFRTAKSFAQLKRDQNTTRLEPLYRPVHATWQDMNADGREDLVLCEFGYHLGALSWFEAVPDSAGLRKHILHKDDGAVSAAVSDFDGDGDPDIIALLANSDERLDLYENDGKGHFTKKNLFRFNPTYGHTAMEMVDWDGDGRMDLLVANGDNGDYPPVLKPHHGIRLYRNIGGGKFEEGFYLAMNGAYGMRARDFDLDGDLDIAAVSFYPDYVNRSQEAFVLFEQTAPGEFSERTFPEVGLSRWMVMDAGDVDGDGDEDIVLGGFNVKSADASEATYQQWMQNDIPVLLLENNAR